MDAYRQIADARAQLVAEQQRITDAIQHLDQAIAVFNADRQFTVQVTVDAVDPAKVAQHIKAVLPAKPAKPTKSHNGHRGGNGADALEKARTRWAEIAKWALAAQADGTYTLAALTERFGTDAKNWRARAEKYGIKTDTPIVSVPKTAMVVACSDCGASFEPHQLQRLHNHCQQHHGRPSHIAERTPVRNASAA